MSCFRHVGFGLRWSADIPLVDFLVDAEEVSADTHLYTKEWPSEVDQGSTTELWYSSPDQGDGVWLKIFRVCDSKYILVQYGDGTDFLVDRSGSRVWCRWRPEFSFAYAATYLYGPLMGLLLRLRGVVCLHASVVSIGDWAIAFAGPQGAGKSTLAAALAAQGFPILSDDILTLRESANRFEAVPTYPRLRLWPESVFALFGSREALTPISEGWDKRHLDLTAKDYSFLAQPQPLRAIYLLGERDDQSPRPRIDVLQGVAALNLLLGNLYVYKLFDRERQSHELEVLSRLTRQVPIKSIIPFADLARIGELSALILHDLESIVAPL